MNALLPLLLCCCQDPAPPTTPLDVVVLKNGDRIEGRITARLDGYVELQLGAGASVGLSTAQIADVLPGAGAATPAVPPALEPRDARFVLHDASGSAVGWLHEVVAAGPDGGFTIHEEYEFVDERTRYHVTSLCTADAAWQPLSCYFRERRSDPVLGSAPLPASPAAAQAGRVLDERIVEAVREGDQLVVVHLDRGGRRERRFDFAPGTTFPLLQRAAARLSGAPVEARLFDPATEDIVVRTFDGARQRLVTIDGTPTRITEFAENTAHGRNAEWLDASARTLRRELAGPALVAVPQGSQGLYPAGSGGAIGSAVVPSPDGTFGLWLPNPAWRALDPSAAGSVSLLLDARGASIGLSRIDHLEKGASLDTAADAVANWFQLLHPDLRITGREPGLVRERATVRLLAARRAGAGPLRAEIDVIPQRDGFLVLACRAPSEAWDELAADFAFVRRSIELDPQSLAPRLQGPLAPAPARPAVPAAPPAAPPRANGPVVRIPLER